MDKLTDGFRSHARRGHPEGAAPCRNYATGGFQMQRFDTGKCYSRVSVSPIEFGSYVTVCAELNCRR
jgi:hypothetical protein